MMMRSFALAAILGLATAGGPAQGATRTGPTGAGMVPGASGGPSAALPGVAAGSTGGNAATGTGAAPSGR